MSSLPNPQHEAFAQARFAGKTLVEAHYAAGYAGDKASASRLNALHEVRERIAELFREAATQTAYEKTNAVRDLLAIIHTAPSDAADDNPFCEVRMGRNGPYHRFPGKLQAMSRLIKLMGWDEPVEIKVPLKDNFLDCLSSFVLRNPPKSCSSSSSSSSSPAIANDGNPSPSTANLPLSPRQEQFALARVKGLGVMAAYHAAGYTGDAPNLAWRINSLPEVQIRIAQLNGGIEDAVGYRKDDAVRDLILIIRATPSEAGPDHPYCETRLTGWGFYHRFPSKLAALTLLARLLNWNGPTKPEVPHDPDFKFKQLREFISKRS